MKREIQCECCGVSARKRVYYTPPEDEDPATAADMVRLEHANGEHISAVRGRAKVPMKCDYCNVPINPGHAAYAVTICHGTEQRYNWEGNLLDL